MSKHLPLLCPSNYDPRLPDGERFHFTKCSRQACHAWENGQCTAGTGMMKWHAEFGNFTKKKDNKMPDCPIADTCTWNKTALARGEPGCVVRRLGALCAHQGGDWSTWEMMGADDPCWRRRGR